MFSRNLIPSTSMLLAFDSTVRTKSFTKAAKELNLTQGAISRQVKSLEVFLGVKLFIRAKKSIFLTKEGEAYAKEIHIALLRIQTSSLYLKTNLGNYSNASRNNKVNNLLPKSLNSGGLLNIAILPTFGTRWLIPRFSSFLQQHPNITANFVFKSIPFDMESEDIHCAIHFGLPNWSGAKCTFLMNEMAIPVATPEFIKKHNISRANSISRAPLLHLKGRFDAWDNWFKKYCNNYHNYNNFNGQGGLIFEQFTAVIQAALSGLGIALLPKIHIESEIKKKELQIITYDHVNSEAAYYFAVSNQNFNYVPVKVFREWLISEISLKRHKADI